MDDINIIEIDKDSPYLDSVQRLFVELFDYMSTSGLLLPLAKDGDKLWRASLEKTIGGRYAILVVARWGDEVIGFGHGTTRFSPNYTGGLKVGYITYVYVSPKSRVRGVGRQIVEALERWFDSKNVHSYELQVLCGNTIGIGFWEDVGYAKELLQMRKFKNGQRAD